MTMAPGGTPEHTGRMDRTPTGAPLRVPLEVIEADPAPPAPPDLTGTAVRDGVAIPYAVHGSDHRPTVVLLPTWTIIGARVWKFQVPFLSRRFRVVTFEGRGAADGPRPAGVEAYRIGEYAADTVAVMDRVGVECGVLVGFSMGAPWAVRAAVTHPDRVSGLVLITANGAGLAHPSRHQPFDEPPATGATGWDLFNRHTWTGGGWEEFIQFFFAQVFTEPHSTKAREDAVRWARRADPEAVVDTILGRMQDGPAPLATDAPQVACPVLVVEGDQDQVRPYASGELLAGWTGGELVVIEGGGHAPHLRDPVRTNHLIEQFVTSTTARTHADHPGTGADHPDPRDDHPGPAPRTWRRAHGRPRRVLYLSSPIGLGHARRDLAVAGELRRHHPDLQVDWLAQTPVTRVLADAGERVHPASALLAGESAHIEAESGEHDLHAFQAIRRMDEILVHNFMVFDDVVTEGGYDLVVGDEAWEVDHFLHENPGLKRFAFAWMTDFVGWLPMPDGGAYEQALAADHNAEMIEQRARYARVRDRSVFVGNPDDVIDLPFGPGLPGIREWTRANFDFAGYVTGFAPPTPEECQRLRHRLGYRAEDLLCVVTVGGSGVGGSLLRRVLDAVPAARRAVPGLHVLVVTGPRIDPTGLPRRRGVSYRGYQPELYRQLAACDVAVVQGGLTTCMELAAADRPFLYVPLRHHFEQNIHVRHRLERYRAGRCLDYETACDPDALAAAIAKELRRETRALPVETDGARRAGELLAELV